MLLVVWIAVAALNLTKIPIIRDGSYYFWDLLPSPEWIQVFRLALPLPCLYEMHKTVADHQDTFLLVLGGAQLNLRRVGGVRVFASWQAAHLPARALPS